MSHGTPYVGENLEKYNDNGLLFLELLLKFDIALANTWVWGPNKLKRTWKHTDSGY